jgi:CrcB protein
MRMALMVMAGGALGSVLRFWCSTSIAHAAGAGFPWGTMVVNVVGSFVIGVFAGLTRPDGILLVGPELRAFVIFGVLGGFTTFSSFSLQTLTLVEDGQWWPAIGNVIGSVAACLIAVWCGAAISTLITIRNG